MRMLKVAQSRNWLPESSRSSGSSGTTAGLFFFSFFPVGDLFRQSLTLTCWPTLPRPCQPATATRPVSLEMETETLRAVITAPPSSCQRPCCWSRRRLATSAHPLPPPSALVRRSPGCLASFFVFFFFCVCGKKKHPKINLPEWCPMVEVRLTESPGCISGITRCSLSQGG